MSSETKKKTTMTQHLCGQPRQNHSMKTVLTRKSLMETSTNMLLKMDNRASEKPTDPLCAAARFCHNPLQT